MRSNPQSRCFHGWSDYIADHLVQNGQPLWMLGPPRKVMRTFFKREFGNGDMSTTKYAHDDRELTQYDHEHGIVSMETLLGEIEAWAAEHGIELPRHYD